MPILFEFVPMGFVAKPEIGKVYVDVGNAFCPGVLDHHHADAPDACTAILVLNHPSFVMEQVVEGKLKVIPHEYPDLDAITGAYFARMHFESIEVKSYHHDWAEYTCRVDQGFTTLDPQQSVTPYSLFMMIMFQVRRAGSCDVHKVSLAMLESGFAFLDTIFAWLDQGGSLDNPSDLLGMNVFSTERELISNDMNKYQEDMERAELVRYELPNKSGCGQQEVSGLWIEKPKSALFKSWARGDKNRAKNDCGFIFLGIQVSDQRFVLSTDPNSDVYLKGLGDLLEQAETEKRKTLGLERVGENRPGYGSSDPWYDGRSPLHHYTIIDSPKAGTVMRFEEVKKLTVSYIGMGESNV